MIANFTQLRAILVDMPSEITPCIEGVHGIGKTEVVRQISTEEWGLKCIELQGSQLADPSDLVGLQKVVTLENGMEETVWVPPYWYPKDGKPFTLFLDELYRANPMIKRAMMQIGNDHKILNFTLPEGSRVILANNPSGLDYEVEEFDPAEQDRFWHITAAPTVTEWIEYITGKIPQVIVDYIGANTSDLDPAGNMSSAGAKKKSNADSGDKDPSRRAWTRLGKAMMEKMAKRGEDCFRSKEGLVVLEMLAAGFVGNGIARNFKAFYASYGSGLTADKFLTMKKVSDKILKELGDMCQRSQVDTLRLGESMARWLDEHCAEFTDGTKATETGTIAAKNWEIFLTSVTPEIQAQVNTAAVMTARKAKKAWLGTCSRINPKLKEIYLQLADIDV